MRPEERFAARTINLVFLIVTPTIFAQTFAVYKVGKPTTLKHKVFFDSLIHIDPQQHSIFLVIPIWSGCSCFLSCGIFHLTVWTTAFCCSDIGYCIIYFIPLCSFPRACASSGSELNSMFYRNDLNNTLAVFVNSIPIGVHMLPLESYPCGLCCKHSAIGVWEESFPRCCQR